MKQNILCILSLLLLLAGCQQEEVFEVSEGKGTLVLESLSVRTGNINTVLTRAVANDLYVEIWQDGKLLDGRKYEPGKVPDTLDLPAGSYLLKAYNQAYNEMSGWENTNLGAAAFSVEKNFTIVAGDINYLSVTVPMVNTGVSLQLPDGFAEQFPTSLFTVKAGERSVEIPDGKTAYFPSDVKISYTLSAENTDQEHQESSGAIDEPKSGTIYVITYDYATEETRITDDAKAE